MDFVSGKYSFEQQNSVPDGTEIKIIDNFYVVKGMNSYMFIEKQQYGKNIIEHYAELYYVFPGAKMIVFFKNNEWYKYVIKNNGSQTKYLLHSVSSYIILNKNICLARNRDIFSLNEYFKNDTEIVFSKTIGTGNDFIISHKGLTKSDKSVIIIGNKMINRKTMYNFENGECSTYVNKGNNKIETPTIVLYYDAIGGADIYDKKGKLVLAVNKYYILMKYLIAYKKGDRYEVLDIKHNKIMFTGNIFSEQKQKKYCIDKKKNEIFVVNYQRKSIDIFKYDTYKTEEKSLKKFNFKSYKE